MLKSIRYLQLEAMSLHSTAHCRLRIQDKFDCTNTALHFQQDPLTQIRPNINAVTMLPDPAWISPHLWDKYTPYLRQNRVCQVLVHGWKQHHQYIAASG